MTAAALPFPFAHSGLPLAAPRGTRHRAARTRRTERAAQWRPGKRYLWLLAIVAPGCALLPSALVGVTSWPALWWSGPFVVFVVVPALDLLVGSDRANPPEESYAVLSADRFYRWCTFAFLPAQYVSLVVACWLWVHGGLSSGDKLGLAIAVGLCGGVGINAAHELGHRFERGERILSKIALAQSFYGHFFVEHNRGHHVHVATPDDPASARYGESVYAFWVRSVCGGFASAIRIERNRLARKGIRFLDPRNNLLQAWLMSVVLFGVLLGVFGGGIAIWLAVQAIVAFLLLETVNYLEHYGLLRERKANGRFRKISPRDSWNSDRFVSNIFLFQLQRHSDHHANPGRRYQTLRSHADAPQLPAGYASMVVFALIPPLWRRVMHPRLHAHYCGDLSKVNRGHGHRRGTRSRFALLVPALVAGVIGAAPVAAEPVCGIDPANRVAAITTLRTVCGSGEQVAAFAAASAGGRPEGITEGWLLSPNEIAEYVPWLWLGKSFDAGIVQNRVTPLGLPAGAGTYVLGRSVLDAAPAWIVEYSYAGITAVRDELREIASGLFLGASYVGGLLVATFLLAQPDDTAGAR